MLLDSRQAKKKMGNWALNPQDVTPLTKNQQHFFVMFIYYIFCCCRPSYWAELKRNVIKNILV